MLTNNVRTSKGFELDTFNMLSRIHANSQLYGTSLQNLLIRSYKEYPGFDLVAQKEVLRQNNILFELCANNVLYEYASTKLYTPLPVHYLSQLASAVSGLPINGSEAFHGAEVARKRHNMFRCGTGQDGEVEVGLHEMLRENDEDFAAYYDTPKILYCTRDYYSNSPDYTRLKRAEEYDGISSISCRIDKDKVLRVVPDDCADIMFSYVHILSDFGVKRATKMQRAETEVAQNRVLAVSAPMPRIN
jgi:hypothetical protein